MKKTNIVNVEAEAVPMELIIEERPIITHTQMEHARMLRRACDALRGNPPELMALHEVGKAVASPLTKELPPILRQACSLTLVQLLSRPQDQKSLYFYKYALSILNALDDIQFVGIERVWRERMGVKAGSLVVDLLPEEVRLDIDAVENEAIKSLLNRMANHADQVKLIANIVQK